MLCHIKTCCTQEHGLFPMYIIMTGYHSISLLASDDVLCSCHDNSSRRCSYYLCKNWSRWWNLNLMRKRDKERDILVELAGPTLLVTSSHVGIEHVITGLCSFDVMPLILFCSFCIVSLSQHGGCSLIQDSQLTLILSWFGIMHRILNLFRPTSEDRNRNVLNCKPNFHFLIHFLFSAG